MWNKWTKVDNGIYAGGDCHESQLQNYYPYRHHIKENWIKHRTKYGTKLLCVEKNSAIDKCRCQVAKSP